MRRKGAPEKKEKPKRPHRCNARGQPPSSTPHRPLLPHRRAVVRATAAREGISGHLESGAKWGIRSATAPPMFEPIAPSNRRAPQDHWRTSFNGREATAVARSPISIKIVAGGKKDDGATAPCRIGFERTTCDSERDWPVS